LNKSQGESPPDALTQNSGAEGKAKCSPLPRSTSYLSTSSKSWKKGRSFFLSVPWFQSTRAVDELEDRKEEGLARGVISVLRHA